ncbi:CaiB/BaiF CoA transferase family protein [Clostridium sp. MT-14]|uniref:CaiB/BaiF CoA transferase family protein n=1 Tax=Clostridium sp. MT-14 TaxID=3348360 RepID=UPI00156C6EC6|nr:Acetyl-CoA:oxalate CoA-transferase [Clostridiaceae bacterium BL-3]
MTKALDGVKVLELCHAYNGPFCGMILADHGAQVLKVESPKGDQCRTWGPFDKKSGESGFFAFLNRNKKGITLNLKNEKALEMFYELVKDADVVIENYRTGVAKKLKVDYAALKKINPRIIYGSSSGFGQTGPLSNRPCYDIVAQSMGGMVNMTGFPDGPPTKVGPSIADNVTGVFLCVGVLMALYSREKTGVGQQIDVAMLDTIFSLLENGIVNYTVAGKISQRQGNIDPSIAPFDIFKAEDGYIAIGVGNDKLFKIFCETIGHEELLENPKFRTNDLRCKNYVGNLQNIIQEWVSAKKRNYIEKLFDIVGLPCGPVLDIKEAIEQSQIKARNMMVEVDHPTMGKTKFQGVTIKLSETPGSVDFAAPLLGQHNREIFNLSKKKYKNMKEKGIF